MFHKYLLKILIPAALLALLALCAGALPAFAQVPVVSLSSTTMTFGSQTVGTTSAAQLMTVANTGSATLIFSNMTLSGDYTWGGIGTCALSIKQAAGTSCAISIRFKPTAAGTRIGVLTIYDNASGGRQTVTLTGTGSAASGSTTPLQIITNTLPSGTASVAYSLSLTASGGTAPYTWSLLSGSLPVGINLSSSGSLSGVPTSSGTASFTVSAKDSASQTATANLSVSISPKATTGPAVSLSATTLTFGSQTVGTTSAAQLVTVANTGNATLTFSNMTLTGDFAWGGIGTCALSISQAAGTSCAISIKFKPTAAGTRTGVLTIYDNASSNQQMVALSGTGSTSGSTTSPAPTISTFSASPASVVAGNTATLSWTTTGASVITINPGAFTSPLSTGTAAVNPTATTTYTLTASNASGSTTATTTVTVSATAGSGAGGSYAAYIAKYQSYANQYYVSPSGSDSNNGSQSSPWATMSHADASTPACSVIWFANGSFNSASTTGAGSSGCHKAFVSQNYGGAKVNGTINSGGAYVDFVGFEVTAPNSCTGFIGPGWGGPGSTNYTLTNVFAYNRVHDIDNASGAPACNGIGGMGGGHSYYGNVIWNIGTNGNQNVHGIYADLGSIVENNVIYNTTGGCIQVGRNPANVTVVNNTLYNCKWGIVLYTMSGSVTPSGNYVANNIIANPSQYGIYECYAANCWGTAGGSSTYTNNMTYNSVNHMENGTLLNNLTANPKVMSASCPASGGDYHLQAGSPAIGAGTHSNAPALDMDGTARGNPPSIGAYE
jgi:hypothetical protein